jgi:hypothetical protein
MICELVAQEPFQTTPASQAALEDLALAAAVEAVIVELQLDRGTLEVLANGGEVLVRVLETPRIHAGSSSQFRDHYLEDFRQRLTERTRHLEGLKALEVKLVED